MLRKVLKNNARTKEYLDKLPKVYGLFLWAKWGILELPWSGKLNKDGIPLVYLYHDFNGEYDEYRLGLINHASSGGFWNCYEDKRQAELARDMLNENPDFEEVIDD